VYGFRGQGDAQPSGDARQTVAPPTVAKRHSDRDHVRPLPPWDTIEMTHQLREEVVREQLLDDQCQECAGPRKLRGTYGEQPHRPWTKLLPPPLGIKPLFCSNGVFELTIVVIEQVTELAQGCTSTNAGARVVRRLVRVGLGRPASDVRKRPRGDTPARRGTRVSEPWSRGGWRRDRGRIVHLARACADSIA
jgi:hypothetical protein